MSVLYFLCKSVSKDVICECLGTAHAKFGRFSSHGAQSRNERFSCSSQEVGFDIMDLHWLNNITGMIAGNYVFLEKGCLVHFYLVTPVWFQRIWISPPRGEFIRQKHNRCKTFQYNLLHNLREIL